MPKYLRLEMQPASGSVVKAGGAGVVDQIVRITNSLQVGHIYRRRVGAHSVDGSTCISTVGRDGTSSSLEAIRRQKRRASITLSGTTLACARHGVDAKPVRFERVRTPPPHRVSIPTIAVIRVKG